MSYLAFCTFDLKNASARDYQSAYADLEQFGLRKVVKADGGNDVVIPTTSVMGTFNGSDAPSVRDYLRREIQSAFQRRGFTSEIFLVVGGDWAWGAAST